MNVVSIKTQANGQLIRAINSSSTYDLAKADFHDTMKRSISDSNITKVVCILMDDDGAVHQYDKWSTQGEQTPTEPAQNQGE